MIVTRIKRRSKGVWTFPDGYRYTWPPYGGEVDVRPDHAEVLLGLDGFEAVEREVVDPPLILPTFEVSEPAPVTLEPAPADEDPPLDLSGVQVDAPVVLPASLDPSTRTDPEPVADVRRAKVRLSHYWSDVELEQAKKEGADV